LRSGAHPVAVVVDFKASLICQSPHMNTREWAEILTILECLDLAITERDASFFGVLALSKLMPSFRVRPEIRSMVCTALAGQPDLTLARTAPFLRNTNVNKGAVVMSDALRAPDVSQESINHYFFPDQWTIHPTNAHYMREFLKLAAAHRIPVFWVLPPIKQKLQSGRDVRGHDDRYLRAVSWLFVRSPNVFLVDARHSEYPDRVFWDYAHLGRAGALALSAGIARAIESVLDDEDAPASRIFQLPNFQELSFDPMPEDLDTSSMAVPLAHDVIRK
jgi:hypothetical protein